MDNVPPKSSSCRSTVIELEAPHPKKDCSRTCGKVFYDGLYASIPATAAFVWLGMLLAYLIYYLTLSPLPNTHRLPRISNRHSIWPYISCIGALLNSSFIVCCACVSTCMIIASIIDAYLAPLSDIRWLRRVKTTFSIISATFLLALSVIRITSGSGLNLHLMLTSVQVWSALLAKTSGWLLCVMLHRRHPCLRGCNPWKISVRWKFAVSIVAFRKLLTKLTIRRRVLIYVFQRRPC